MIQFILLLVSLIVSFTAYAEVNSGDAVAVITGISGEAHIEDNSEQKKSYVLDLVFMQNKVIIPESSRVTLVLLSTGSELIVDGPNTVTFDKQTMHIAESAKSKVHKLLPTSIEKPIKANGLRYASLRMRGNPAIADINEVIPNGSMIADTTPRLEWQKTNSAVTYSITVYDDAANIVYESTTQDTYVEIPADKCLSNGGIYTWQIQSRSQDGVVNDGFGDFAVASESQISEISPYLVESGKASTKSEHVLYALMLESHGFMYEASKHWKAIGGDHQIYAGSYSLSSSTN